MPDARKRAAIASASNGCTRASSTTPPPTLERLRPRTRTQYAATDHRGPDVDLPELFEVSVLHLGQLPEVPVLVARDMAGILFARVTGPPDVPRRAMVEASRGRTGGQRGTASERAGDDARKAGFVARAPRTVAMTSPRIGRDGGADAASAMVPIAGAREMSPRGPGSRSMARAAKTVYSRWSDTANSGLTMEAT